MRLRVLLIAAIVAVALVHPASANADDPAGRRDQTKAKQAQVQSQLDLARASDAAVESRLNVLNADVTISQHQLEDAQRAQGAASVQVADATRRLAAATARLDQTRRKLQTMAVRAYMRPLQLAASAGVLDVNALARGRALLSVAASSQTDAVDASRQAQRDHSHAETVVKAALGSAAARTKEAASRAADLASAQRAQQDVHNELQKRIAELRKESADLATQQAGIEAVIATRANVGQTAMQPGGEFTSGPASATGLIWPIHGPVTSEFGSRWGGFHPGIDIAPTFGTPIHAAKAGVVILAGWVSGYGNYVLIDHGGGLVTGYGHQSRLAVTQGQTVSQGQVIGFEGSTGLSTGPHLHFEVRINGSVQNPRNYLAGSP